VYLVLKEQADLVKQNMGVNCIKRCKSVNSGIQQTQSASQQQQQPPEIESPTKSTPPSAPQPNDGCSPALDPSKQMAVTAPEAAARPSNLTKKDVKKEKDEKIKDMIAQTTKDPAIKGTTGLRFALKSETSSLMAAKVALPNQIKLNLNPGNSSHMHMSRDQTTTQQAEGQIVPKKVLTINLKSRTSQNSRSRLDTSEDKQKKLDSIHEVNHLKMGNKHLRTQEDSDESDAESKVVLGIQKSMQKLDSLLRPAALSVKLRSAEPSELGTSLMTMGRSKSRHQSNLQSSHQTASTQIRVEHNVPPLTNAGPAPTGIQGEVQASPISGVPVVLSRNKNRTSSLTLGRSLLPKPPSLLRG
jgi:hypothetical protein